MRPVLTLVLALASCHRGPAAADPATRETTAAPPRVDPCANRSGVIVTGPRRVPLACADGHRRCSATSVTTVRNCDPDPVVLQVLEMRDGGTTWTYEPRDGHLDPGGATTIDRSWSREQSVTVAARFTSGEETRSTEPIPLSVINPARDAAMAACRACGGDWGGRGMAATEGCICATTDAGQTCDDGEDCQGPCLFDRFVEVRSATTDCDPDGSCTVHLATGRPTGRCASRKAIFGCHARIRDGASREPPRLLPSRAPLVCAD